MNGPNPLPSDWEVNEYAGNAATGLAAQWQVTWHPEYAPSETAQPVSWNITAGYGGVVVLDSHGDLVPRNVAESYLVIRDVLIEADRIQADWDANTSRSAT